MTDHLPECTLPKGWGDCICGELRSCEQRTLQAARDAVAALPHALNCWDRYGDHIAKADALAAIDGLRGSGNPDTPPSAEKGEQA